MQADSLAGRMLCAGNLAYDIRDGGKVTPRGEYLVGAGVDRRAE